MAGAKTKLAAGIIPTMRYSDAVAAIEWLRRAFGFEQHLVVPDADGGIAHAQLTLGDGMINTSTANRHIASPS